MSLSVRALKFAMSLQMMKLMTLGSFPGPTPDMADNTGWREKFPSAPVRRVLDTPCMPAEEAFGPEDERMMRIALERAAEAAQHGDVPIGAAIARDGELLAAAGNEREHRPDPTAHAEVLALREAAAILGGWRLPGTVLYVTLEPCAMCAGAIALARVPRLVFAAADPKGGAAGSVLDLFSEPVVNHRPAVESGLLAAESAALLESFFAARR